jgi:hypothetical protein
MLAIQNICAIIQLSKTMAQDAPLIIARTSSSDALRTNVPFSGEILPVAMRVDMRKEG